MLGRRNWRRLHRDRYHNVEMSLHFRPNLQYARDSTWDPVVRHDHTVGMDSRSICHVDISPSDWPE